MRWLVLLVCLAVSCAAPCTQHMERPAVTIMPNEPAVLREMRWWSLYLSDALTLDEVVVLIKGQRSLEEMSPEGLGLYIKGRLQLEEMRKRGGKK